MGIIRNGTAVSQLTFVPADGVVMGGDPFIALGMRAQERLAPTRQAQGVGLPRNSRPRVQP